MIIRWKEPSEKGAQISMSYTVQKRNVSMARRFLFILVEQNMLKSTRLLLLPLYDFDQHFFYEQSDNLSYVSNRNFSILKEIFSQFSPERNWIKFEFLFNLNARQQIIQGFFLYAVWSSNWNSQSTSNLISLY